MLCKKFVILGLVGAIAAFGFAKTKFGSYAKMEASTLSEWADDQIPVEKKIAQMRKEAGLLDKDIEHVKCDLAKEIVAVRELACRTSEFRASLESEQKSLVARGEKLKDQTERVTNDLTKTPSTNAKERLRADVAIHVKRQQQLTGMEKQLEHRERIKDSLQKQLDGLIQKKTDIKTDIDAVEAEYQALQYQQIESKYQTDDSRLSEIKQSLHDLKRKLEVERTKLELSPQVEEKTEGGPTTALSVDDILAPLNPSKPANVAKKE